MVKNFQRLSSISVVAAALAVSHAKSAAPEFEANLEKSFSLSGAGKLSIEADRGSINVKTDGADKAEIRVWRKVKGGSKQKADELFKNHQVTFDQDGNNVSVVAKNKTQLRSF